MDRTLPFHPTQPAHLILFKLILCLRMWLCPVMKWIRRPRSLRLYLLANGTMLPLRLGSKTFVHLQEWRWYRLDCQLQFPHYVIANLVTCPLWRARCVWTEYHSWLTPTCKTEENLSCKILLPDFLAKVNMAKRRASDTESLITGWCKEGGRCLERMIIICPLHQMTKCPHN